MTAFVLGISHIRYPLDGDSIPRKPEYTSLNGETPARGHRSRYLRFKGLIRPAPEVYSRFEGLMPKYSRSETGGMALAQMGFYMRSSG